MGRWAWWAKVAGYKGIGHQEFGHLPCHLPFTMYKTWFLPVLHSFTAFLVIHFTILEVTKSMNSHASVVIDHHQSCVVKMMKESAIIRTHICHITFFSTSHLITTHEKSPSNSTILNSLDQNPHQKCVYSHFLVSRSYLSYLSLYIM